MKTDKPTYVQNRGRTFRFPSMEEVIRNSSDKELDLILYGCAIENPSPREKEIAEDEVTRRLKGAS
jgi:hypothetical protein